MTCKPRKNRRDNNQVVIVKALRALGATVIPIEKPVDLLVGIAGVNILMEVKGEKGKLTPAQVAFFEQYKGQCVVVRTVEDAVECVNKIIKNRG